MDKKGKPEKGKKLGKQGSNSKLRGAGAGGDAGGDADDFDAWMKSRQLLKPDDQLELTEAELAEEVSKVLTATNTNIIHNLVAFSFKEGQFVPLPLSGNVVTLLEFDGHALHIDSEEAKDQIEELGELGYPLPPPKYSSTELETERKAEEAAAASAGAEGDAEGEEEERAGIEEEEAEAEDVEGEEEEKAEDEAEPEEEEGAPQEGTEGEGEEDATSAGAPVQQYRKKRKLINQFNFCERATLTYTYPRRNVDTQTIPPPRSNYRGNVLQWVIYDSYAKDFADQQSEKEKKEKKEIEKRSHLSKNIEEKPKITKAEEAEILNKKYLRSWQILERMINQNIFDDVANDYRYWEDPADEFREGEGTLLPLWKFQYDRVKKMNVTDMMFNPSYYDLFAVCFGSHDFMKQPNDGAICLFTIKNPSYPDYIIMTQVGVMCCDIHPDYPFLVAIGMYDGTVAVYTLREEVKEPLYVSTGNESKHAECVWEIKWGPDMADGEINFYSISSDGRVFNWVLMQNKLMLTNIITLYLEGGIVAGPDGTEVRLRSCGSCMTFHPSNKEIYLAGTEEGFILKCSISFSSKYLMTYFAHNLSVYRIDFNRFNSNIFISCSGDWRVKIWEDMRADPLFIFDLGSPVGDVKWAPFSSTVFAACTMEGKVFVFDLNVNKYKAICQQAVVPKRKNKLTRLSFNEKLPFIIVGDDKGGISSLKLSPNLRVMVKPPKKQLYLDQRTLQIQKLEKLLSLVRELPDGAVAPETTTTAQS